LGSRSLSLSKAQAVRPGFDKLSLRVLSTEFEHSQIISIKGLKRMGNSKTSPVILMILDGWGIREMEHGNAVFQAETPNYASWLQNYERSILDASGEAVGLPPNQMGNSEVGHLNLGAGRVVYQDIMRINRALEDGSFFEMAPLIDLLNKVKEEGSTLHIMGLLGPGGVHSHTNHLYALLKVASANGVTPVVHVITDGRDTPPNSALDNVIDLERVVQEYPATIATVSGRYYAMDRDNRWERTKLAFDAIIEHKGIEAASPSQAVADSYAEDVADEFILPRILNPDTEQRLTVEPGDCVIYFNFRADRMRQIVTAMIMDDFDGFERPELAGTLNALTFTPYNPAFPVSVLFDKGSIDTPLAETISRAGLRQFHTAETEKYPHVTYFFNGGREQPFEGEDRSMAQSPKVATYDLQPEMSAYELTETLLERIASRQDDFLLINYANPDMVGHTGSLAAATKAVETVDECAGRVVKAITELGGVALVTADHGNAERMVEEVTGEAHTYHTTSPVSFIVIGKDYYQMRPRGILADVAPTVLDLLGVPKPSQMTGESLIEAKRSN
jgi:2,3-bisphosphoglycerate-independent phosphoglycerate mutase